MRTRRALIGIGAAMLVAAAFLAPAGGARAAERFERLDIPYMDTGNKQHRLDVIAPALEGAPKPILVFVHGGGFRNGSKEGQRPLSRHFADDGIAVVNVEYRLVPEVQHPHQVKDVAAAIAWAKANAASFNGDPDLLFVSGHSAGAHLIALATIDTRHIVEAGLAADAIKGMLPISGFFEFENWGYGEQVRDPVFGGTEGMIDGSPAHHIHAGMPPMLLLHGSDEAGIAGQNKLFERTLTEFGFSDFRRIEFAGKDHAGMRRGLVDADDPVYAAVMAFLSEVRAR
ncbi:MAG: alpha/beta hydrolase [Alphaproteobacteria bacterium]|nr:alpha/beta hydrolase [Alphaproteobacteria bacterium]